MALAVIIAVAASLAIRGSQHKISESRAKEANIEAKLALDSAASRLLSHLDRIFEIKGAYSGGELQPIPPSRQFETLGSGETVKRRCPGGATQPAADGSNPLVEPPFAGSGVTSSQCNPADAP